MRSIIAYAGPSLPPCPTRATQPHEKHTGRAERPCTPCRPPGLPLRHSMSEQFEARISCTAIHAKAVYPPPPPISCADIECMILVGDEEMYARKHMPQTGPHAVLALISCPSANLSFIDLAIAPRSTRAKPRSIPRRLHVHSHGLRPSSSFYSPPSLSVNCYLASRRRLSVIRCLPSSSRTAYPLRCDAIECGHFVHGYSLPAQIRRIPINIVISASYPPSPSFPSVPPPPACCVRIRIPSTPLPSFHPLVAATANIALGSPRWASPPSPRRLPIFPSRSRPQEGTIIRPHATFSAIPPTDGYLLRRPRAPDGGGFCRPRGLFICSFADTRRRRR
ncbi:hypothetical protein DFH08DRAFT_842002 [Mycena albidolilacea]|uniref:Uncharacterized protein n=1 Tax=Mycena albidolilacea TaxID=1033008 RepID=A0AAD7AMX4_9AGAR|nr:hypothetical protein DFH08DRAFT_842002 [Mycena albidolilacea]